MVFCFWVLRSLAGLSPDGATGRKAHHPTRRPILRPAARYSVTRSSHLTIESMTTIEIVQATTKTPQVIQMGIDS